MGQEPKKTTEEERVRRACRTCTILALAGLLLAGCDDGWDSNEREYYGEPAEDTDDDDATAPGDDDDSTPTADDDDSTPLPDDDDSTPITGGDLPSGSTDWDVVATVLGPTDFGLVSIFDNLSREIEIENTGTNALSISVSLQTNGPASAMQVLGPSPTLVNPSQNDTWTLWFSPTAVGVYTATALIEYGPSLGGPPGPWVETLSFTGEAEDPNAGEANCSNGLDDDLDGLTDCDDPNCTLAPECGGVDPCCEGGVDAFNNCGDGLALTCVCGLDSTCCGTWSTACADLYAISCGATTCSP